MAEGGSGGAWRTISVALTADARGLKTTLDKSSADVKRFGEEFEKQGARAAKSLDEIGGKLQSGGLKAVATGGLIAAGLYKAVGAASDLNESLNFSDTTFGSSADEIEAWAGRAAKSLGLSKQEALDAAAGFGVMFKQLGQTDEQAASMSQRLTKLAADLASKRNTSVPDALTALSAGLRGETEPLRRYGILLDEFTLKQEAMRLGLVKTTTGTLPPAIRAQAAYAAILRSGAYANDDFQNTSGDLANSTRIATAEFKDQVAELGQGLLPVMKQVVVAGSDVLGFFNTLPGWVKTGVADLTAIAATLSIVGGGLSFVAGAAAKVPQSFQDMREAITSAKDALSRMVGIASEGGKGIPALAEGVNSANSASARLSGTIGGQLTGSMSTAGAVASGVFAVGLAIAVAEMFTAKSRADDLAAAVKSIRDQAASTGETLGTTFKRDLIDLAVTGTGPLSKALGDSKQLFLNTIDEINLTPAQLAKGLSGSAAEFEAFKTRTVNAAREAGAGGMGYLGGQLETLRAAFKQAGVDAAVTEQALAQLGITGMTAGAGLDAGAKSMEDYAKKVEAAASAQEKWLGSVFDYGQAQRDLADAEKGVADARADGAARIEQADRSLASAERTLADAHQRTEDAARGIADAYAQAREELDRLRDSSTEAGFGQRRAEFSLKDATKARADAQRKLDLANTTRDPDKIAAAQDALDRAQLDYEEALYRRDKAVQQARDSQQQLNDANQRGLDQSPQVRAAVKNLEDAKRNEADASLAVRDAEKERQKAGVDAAQAVTDAQWKLVDAWMKLNEQTLIGIAMLRLYKEEQDKLGSPFYLWGQGVGATSGTAASNSSNGTPGWYNQPDNGETITQAGSAGGTVGTRPPPGWNNQPGDRMTIGGKSANTIPIGNTPTTVPGTTGAGGTNVVSKSGDVILQFNGPVYGMDDFKSQVKDAARDAISFEYMNGVTRSQIRSRL